jgi:hypothetical protein
VRTRLVVLYLLIGGARVEAQLASPGELARPHLRLEGITNCTKCHSAGEQVAADRCLDCHGELRTRMDKSRGYHGRLGATQKRTCESCHHEHQGVGAKLIDWGGAMERFDHGKTGWPLRGKHAGEKCTTCHEAQRLIDADAHALLKRAGRTFLGVGASCTTCHFDEHRGQLGNECGQCHEEKAWKPARFDHSGTKYPLVGKHRQVACDKCHARETDSAARPPFPPPRAATFLKYAPLAHARCNDCHADPHQGRFGGGCEGCHTVEGWSIIRNAAEERKFHDKTRFPLRGAHAAVACPSCHGPWPGKPAKFKGLPHDKCMDCHSDAHRGQLTPPACERCHTVETFAPARFELEQHQQTKYPLEGAHAAVPCVSCHKPDTTAVKTNAFPPSSGSATHGRHRHAAQTPARAQLVSALQFRIAGRLERCETCHIDVHGGQLKDATSGCVKCHLTASFTELKFDHQRDSRFALTGRHTSVRCGTCHRAPGANAPVRYRPIDLACASCHTDVHAGQLGRECAQCHVTDSWKTVGFSHDDGRFTTFKLEGRHAAVACSKCHVTLKTAAGQSVVRYRPLPQACEACHVDVHQGEFRGFVP